MSETIKAVKSYLRTYNIPYKEYLSKEAQAASIVMRLEGFPDCPEGAVELSLFFFDTVVEARCYYTQTGSRICQDTTHSPELYRFLNYLNARLWLNMSDGAGGCIYAAEHVTTPRFYMTEDEGQDLCCTIVVPNWQWEADELKYGDYLTRYMPEVMNSLAPAFFGILLGNVTPSEAISYIRTKIQHEAV